MKAFTTAGFALLVLIFSSCQKEPGTDFRGNGPNGTAGDSTILSKLVSLDTTSPAGLDTVSVALFSYDSRGRLSEVNFYFREDTSSSPDYTDHEIMRHYYQGNDTLAYKSTYAGNVGGILSTDTIYYTYQQGFVSSDSSIKFFDDPAGYFREIMVQSYSVAGNQVTAHVKQTTIYYPNPPIECTGTYNYVLGYSNGNIASENGTSSGCGTGFWDKQVTYDDKINPLYPLDIHYRILIGSNSFFDAQKNNVTETTSSSMNEHVKNVYTYRSDGYPLVVRSQDLLDPSYNVKGLYFYTR